MKFEFFNDTGREVSIHPATESHGTSCSMSRIQTLESRTFVLPEGTYPMVKLWDYGSNLSILVSHKKYEEGI